MSSIRDAIAQKRAEAAKRAAALKQQSADDADQLATDQRPVDDVIRRGQQTGSVNLTGRQLASVPVYLFECHLGIVPDSMKATHNASSAQAGTSWYGARDLSILKLANNEISAIPSEISLFGAITILDLHGNLLEKIPNAICDLTDLAHLDVSHNRLRSLPHALVNSPTLAVLNLSHNDVADLGWTAAKPLPRLHALNISHNPLGPAPGLFDLMNRLPSLRELRMRSCHLTSSSVTVPGDRSRILPALTLLDIEENALDFTGVQLLLGDDRIASFEGEPGRIHVLAGGRVIKEKWEIEAERRVRRVRSRPSMPPDDVESALPPPMPADLALATATDRMAISPSSPAEQSGSTTLAKWYDAVHGALNLPQCLPVRTRGPPAAKPDGPQQTLPVQVFYQAFAPNLRSLSLSNRRVDKTFILPDALLSGLSDGKSLPILFLPRLQELSLDGCGLTNDLDVAGEKGPSQKRPIFATLQILFPSVTTLDLSYNQLSTYEGLAPLLRQGLKILRLRGNQFQNLDVFLDLAEDLRAGTASGVQLTELDVRENNIDKLHPPLGVLPLTGFFVDGNVFRVPQRRVWEREGTQGLLKWLKDRLE